MRFENSKYFEEFQCEVLNFSFGTFYLCERFFLSELNEGVHFDWIKVTEVMNEIVSFYGKEAKLAYLSNRVNSYSVDPHCWGKVDEKYKIIFASAIVSYNNFTLMNATLEKNFTDKSIKRCFSLDEAIDWISNLREFK